MSNQSFDGLCGIINLYATSDNQVRCKYEFGHSGPHSWAKIITHVIGGITHEEVENRNKK